MSDEVLPTSIKPGDIVQLRGGGPAMTAGQFDPKKGRRCVWHIKGDLKEKFYADEMLEEYQEVVPPNIKVSFLGGFEPKFKEVLQAIADGANNPREMASAILLEAANDPGESLEQWRQRRSGAKDHSPPQSGGDETS